MTRPVVMPQSSLSSGWRSRIVVASKAANKARSSATSAIARAVLAPARGASQERMVLRWGMPEGAAASAGVVGGIRVRHVWSGLF